MPRPRPPRGGSQRKDEIIASKLAAKLLAVTLAALVITGAAWASNYTQARAAIYRVFGPYAPQAMRVAHCETGGTYDPRARNGQFQGIFQMGDYARGRYGHGPGWLVQAAAAYLYFVDSGRDWGPWSCKP